MSSNKHNLIHYLFTAFYTLMKSLISSLVWIGAAALGLMILRMRISPWDALVGLPLLLIGGGLALNHFTDATLAIFYPSYNRGVCIFCNK